MEQVRVSTNTTPVRTSYSHPPSHWPSEHAQPCTTTGTARTAVCLGATEAGKSPQLEYKYIKKYIENRQGFVDEGVNAYGCEVDDIKLLFNKCDIKGITIHNFIVD